MLWEKHSSNDTAAEEKKKLVKGMTTVLNKMHRIKHEVEQASLAMYNKEMEKEAKGVSLKELLREIHLGEDEC